MSARNRDYRYVSFSQVVVRSDPGQAIDDPGHCGRGKANVVSEFLQMGGYAGYVWSAFGFAALVLVGLLAQSWWSARRRELELAQLRALVRPAVTRAKVQAPRRVSPRAMAGVGSGAETGER